MNFKRLVARLGVAEVARRAGVSAGTVRRWLEDGVSKRYQDDVLGILQRHLRSLAAAETRKQRAQEETGIVPPEDSELAPEEVLPTKAPAESREVKSTLRFVGLQKRRLTSTRVTGEISWFRVGLPVMEVDDATISERAIQIWRHSGRRFCSVKLLFFRFIPWNPIYKGELLRLKGKWVEAWQSTSAQSGPESVRRQVEYYMARAKGWAETRVIFLEAVGVSAFDYIEKKTSRKSIMDEELQ